MGVLADALERRLRLATPRLQGRVLVELRRAAPKKTRQLQDSIRVRARYAAGLLTVTAEAPVVQAATTERGARAHVITTRPPNRKARSGRGRGALRFKVGGKTLYRRRVNHPGNRPKPWFFPTLRRWGSFLSDELAR